MTEHEAIEQIRLVLNAKIPFSEILTTIINVIDSIETNRYVIFYSTMSADNKKVRSARFVETSDIHRAVCSLIYYMSISVSDVCWCELKDDSIEDAIKRYLGSEEWYQFDDRTLMRKPV